MTHFAPVARATWILTGSPENYAATRERGFTLIGMKERRRRQAEAMLPGDEWLPAEDFVGRLEHIRKWPAEHWTLAFQGQLRTVSEHDAGVLLEAMGVSALARLRDLPPELRNSGIAAAALASRCSCRGTSSPTCRRGRASSSSAT